MAAKEHSAVEPQSKVARVANPPGCAKHRAVGHFARPADWQSATQQTRQSALQTLAALPALG